MAKAKKGPRPKHIPLRTCVVCRQERSKRDLVRIVRTLESGVVVDPGGKLAGRGAYLCRSQTCWEQALQSQRLSGALKTALTAADLAGLRDYSMGLPAKIQDEAET